MEAFLIPSNSNYYQVYFDIKSHKIPAGYYYLVLKSIHSHFSQNLPDSDLIGLITVLCKSLEPPLLFLYFALKEPDILIAFKNGLEQ